MTELAGKSPVEIAAAVAPKRRGELIEMIVNLATVEATITPAQLAKRRGMHRRTIVRLIEDRKLRAHRWTEKDYQIPLSAIREYDAATAIGTPA